MQQAVDRHFELLSNHYMSYDMWSRPRRHTELPVIDNVFQQFSAHCFHELSGFWHFNYKKYAAIGVGQ
jgi:hypothetical protein